MRRAMLPTITFCLALLSTYLPVGRRALNAQSERSAELVERHTFIERAMTRHVEVIAGDLPSRGPRPKPEFSDTLAVMTALIPFGDWDYYYLRARGGGIELSDGELHETSAPGIIWTPNPRDNLKTVDVPDGFVTDLTSIPRMFWTVLRPEGRYAYAAVIHDYLYWTQTRPRDEADQILKIAMRDSDVDPASIDAIYSAVRVFGERVWNTNRRLKQSGERRILKKFPRDFRTSWGEWKKQRDVFAD